jgi:muramoyltetrapeptide carboxypeptidase
MSTIGDLDLRVPEPLRPGDTIGIVSPSFGGVGTWPHRAEAATAYLAALGLKVRFMTNSRRAESWVSTNAKERVADLHEAFADPDVRLVLCGIGGDHSNQLVEHLDYELIGADPKWFQGYSDITVLHWAFLQRCRVASFHGPTLVPELGEHPAPLSYTDRWLRAAWFRKEPLDPGAPDEWTDEFLDWDQKADLARPRTTKPTDGWSTVRAGRAGGPLLGGCLETIVWHLKGSDEWIEPDGTIFFLETSEEAPSLGHVDAYLTDLGRLGIFGRISGLMFGRPYGYDSEQNGGLLQLLRKHTEAHEVPVLGNVDLGHTDPMLTLPLGVPARLDAGAPSLEIDL